MVCLFQSLISMIMLTELPLYFQHNIQKYHGKLREIIRKDVFDLEIITSINFKNLKYY